MDRKDFDWYSKLDDDKRNNSLVGCFLDMQVVPKEKTKKICYLIQMNL